MKGLDSGGEEFEIVVKLSLFREFVLHPIQLSLDTGKLFSCTRREQRDRADRDRQRERGGEEQTLLSELGLEFFGLRQGGIVCVLEVDKIKHEERHLPLQFSQELLSTVLEGSVCQSHIATDQTTDQEREREVKRRRRWSGRLGGDLKEEADDLLERAFVCPHRELDCIFSTQTRDVGWSANINSNNA